MLHQPVIHSIANQFHKESLLYVRSSAAFICLLVVAGIGLSLYDEDLDSYDGIPAFIPAEFFSLKLEISSLWFIADQLYLSNKQTSSLISRAPPSC